MCMVRSFVNCEDSVLRLFKKLELAKDYNILRMKIKLHKLRNYIYLALTHCASIILGIQLHNFAGILYEYAYAKRIA